MTDDTVSDLALRGRTRKALEHNGIQSVAELTGHTREELAELPGVGTAMVNEIERVLHRKHLHLTLPPPPEKLPRSIRAWKQRYRDRVAEQGGWPKDPDELMFPNDVAAVLRVTPNAIYQYRRYGNIPVPDLQEGGREPKPGETIEWKGKKLRKVRPDGTVVLLPTSNRRTPRAGELLETHRIAWRAWRVYRWTEAERPGRGWHASGEQRKRMVDRPRRNLPPGAWIPPPRSREPVVIEKGVTVK